jgi:hypothetical protein
MAQEVARLPSKCKALSPNPSTVPRSRKKERKRSNHHDERQLAWDVLQFSGILV